MLAKLSGVNLATYFFFRDKLPINMKVLMFFLANCVWTAAKSMVVKRKKPEGPSSAIFGVETAAKSCELKRCADRVCSRTDNKDEVLLKATFNLSPELFRLN